MSNNDKTGHIDVRYVADLARIELTEQEAERYQSELGAILDYVDQLAQLDVGGIEPMAHANPVTNVMREDVACSPCADRDEVLRNAPNTHDDALIRVPVVIDGEGA